MFTYKPFSISFTSPCGTSSVGIMLANAQASWKVLYVYDRKPHYKIMFINKIWLSRWLTCVAITPMQQAVDISLSPNQTAATFGGTGKTNTWHNDKTNCPIRANQNLSGLTAITFIHAPKHVPVIPSRIVARRP